MPGYGESLSNSTPQNGYQTQLTPDSIVGGPASQGSLATGGQTGSLPQVAAPAFQKSGYERADENIATQSLYLENRIQTLEELSSPESDNFFGVTGSTGARDWSNPSDGRLPGNERLERETEGFCTKDITPQEGQDCLNNYIEMKRAQLEKIKPTLEQNTDSVARLQSKPLDADGKPIPGLSDGGGVAVAPSVAQGKVLGDSSPPFVPKFVDLTPAYEKVESADVKTQRAQMEGFKNEVTEAPKEQDFYKTEEVLIDPSQPSEGTTLVLKLKADGQPDVDKEAYGKALQAWKTNQPDSIYKDRGDQGKGGDQSAYFKSVATRTSQVEKERLQRATPRDRPGARDLAGVVGATGNDPKSSPKNDATDIRKDFVKARNELVMNFNGEVPPSTAKNRQGANNLKNPTLKNQATSDNGTEAAQAQKKDFDNFMKTKEAQDGLSGIREEDLKLKPSSGSQASTKVNSVYLEPQEISDFIHHDVVGSTPAATPTASQH